MWMSLPIIYGFSSRNRLYQWWKPTPKILQTHVLELVKID